MKKKKKINDFMKNKNLRLMMNYKKKVKKKFGKIIKKFIKRYRKY